MDGTPLLAPELIPSLVVPQTSLHHPRRLRPTLAAFVLALSLGQLREEDLYREALAQVEKLQQNGIRVTHLDTHKHTHMFPLVTRVLLSVARELEIPAIRNPFEPRWNRRLGHGGALRRTQIRSLAVFRSSFRRQPLFQAPATLRGPSSGATHPNYTVRTTDGTLAISATGSLDRARLRDLLTHLPDGVWELCCHPGYVDPSLNDVGTRLRQHREVERQALLDVLPEFQARDRDLKLISYAHL